MWNLLLFKVATFPNNRSDTDILSLGDHARATQPLSMGLLYISALQLKPLSIQELSLAGGQVGFDITKSKNIIHKAYYNRSVLEFITHKFSLLNDALNF